MSIYRVTGKCFSCAAVEPAEGCDQCEICLAADAPYLPRPPTAEQRWAAQDAAHEAFAELRQQRADATYAEGCLTRRQAA